MKKLILALALASLPLQVWAQDSSVLTLSAASTTCAGTACNTLGVGGYGSAAVQLIVTGTATAVVEGSINGQLFTALTMSQVSGSGNVTSATATGSWSVNVAGFTQVRVRLSACTSCNVVTMLQATRSGGGAGGGGGGGGGDASAANQSTEITSLQLIDDLVLTQGGTTSGKPGLLGLGAVTTAAPTYTNGQTSALSLDTTGALRVAGGGGGTQYTQDAPAAATPVGTAPMLVRQDTLSAGTVSTDGDNIAARGTAKGEANVHDTDLVSMLGAPTDAKSTATDTTSITAMSVLKQISASVQAPPSQAVTNAGTFVTQSVVTNAGTFATQSAATQSGTWNMRLQDGSGNALTSLVDGAQRALTVSIVDSSGNQVSSFGGSGGTASAFGSVYPSGASSGTAAGFSDGTNMQGARVIDLDTGAGTFYGLSTNSVFRASGGPVEAGTSSNPWNVVFPSSQAVTGPLTDTQLRATAVPISGTVTATGPLTDTQLRATAVPISVASLPSVAVTNVGTFAVQAAAAQSGTWTVQPGNTANTTAWKVDGSAVTQPVSVASIPSHAVTNAGTFAVQATIADNALATLGAKADAKSTATDTTSISAMSVLKQISASVQAPPSQAVTNAGTFSVQVSSMPTTLPPFPAASALADAQANPTTPLIGAAMMAFNGSTWDRLQPALDYAQNSTTSGQTGSLVQGAVTTSAPTYTSAHTSPLSLDTSGSLRVAVVSGSTGNAAASNTGSAVPTQADYAGINVGGTLRGLTGVNPSGSIYAGQMDMSAVAGATTSVNNGAVDAGTLRVTLANNSTGTLSTVSTVTNLSQLGGVALPIEDAAETAGGVGIYAMGVRRDTRASSAGSTGDNTMASYDATGGLWVNPFGITQAAATYLTVRLSDGSNFLTSAADQTEDAASAGGENGPMVLSVRRDTAVSSAGTAGDFATFNTDAAGKLWVSGAFAEDAAHTDGDIGLFALARRIDTPTSSSGTSGDYSSFNTNNVGALWVSQVDPCSSEAKITAPFSLTARGVIISSTASKKNYICAITVVAGAAEIFNIDEGTGTTCQTGTAAVVGSTTAANGLSFAANGGMAAIGGNSTVIAGLTANVDTCVVPSSTNRLAGFVTYVQR